MINDVNCAFLAGRLMHNPKIDAAAVTTILTHFHDFNKSGAQMLLNLCQQSKITRHGLAP